MQDQVVQGVQQADSGETVAVQASAKAPRWLLPSIITLVAGGVGGGAVMSVASPKVEVQQPVRDPVEQNRYADQAADKAREDCRRDLAAAQAQLSTTLTRLEGKVDAVAGDVGTLKVDVGVLKADVQQLKERRPSR